MGPTGAHVRRQVVSWVVLCTLFLAAGCAGEGLAPPAQDAVAKAAHPAPGRAHILVYRSSNAGTFAHHTLLVNGTPRGILDPRTFFLLDVPPGKVTITIDAVRSNSIEETVVAGDVKYVNVTLGPNLRRGASGVTVSFDGFPMDTPKESATKDLENCRLIRTIKI